MKSGKMIFLVQTLLLTALLSVFIVSMSDFGSGCEDIYDNMLRLHVIANSDSDKDQRLKLIVRDELLTAGKEAFDKTVSKHEATRCLIEKIPFLEKTAERVLRENGSTDKVKISVEKTYFETRKYENLTVPAGFYDAVRVEIGKAEGRNWWCVMFPPLCLPAVTDGYEEMVFSQTGEDVLNSEIKFDIRFKAVELYQSAKKIAEKINK